MVAEAMATDLTKHDYHAFWKRVNKTKTPFTTTFATNVGNASGPTAICEMWFQHYNSLFNSIGFAPAAYTFNNNMPDNLITVSGTEISTVLNNMKNNKAADCNGLCTEHFKIAGDAYYNVLAVCYNAMFIHGHMPAEASQIVLCPVVKDKNGDISVTSNYRPIALTTIFSKVLEHVMLNRMSDYLHTSDNQFGFKQRHSTLMPVLLLKEVLNFYRDNGSNVYVCFLDASKAFDRVDYNILFNKLTKRNIPGYLLRLLLCWYCSQFGRVLWAGVFSETFNITNGVRQGGVLSPFLFAVYIDEITYKLQMVNVGCYVGYRVLNHLLFADDAVIFAPSAKGLQQLLDICADFAISHNIVFNTVKSQCLIVTSKWAPVNPPAFYLNSTLLPVTDSYKYLGHIINSRLTDDLDIQKQTRSLYARANMLKRRFSAASLHTKCMLFNAYCTPMYGCQLWNVAYRYNYDRLRVAFNDAFRLLLDVPRWTSASSLFVLHRVPTFAAVIRKFTFTLYDCMRNSSNSLLIAYVQSDLFYQSKLLLKWRKLLYTCMD